MGHLRLVGPLAVATLLLAAGCGDDSSDDDTAPGAASTSPAAGPDCSEVWSGETLPADYEGCVSDGELVEADAQMCASEQVLVTYDDRYYAVLGGPINDMDGPLSESQQYRKAARSCGG